MLYSRYSNPLEFMRLYIDQGRFGEWVTEIIAAENQRRKEQAEKEDEEKLWNMYVHSYPETSFNDWKAEALGPVRPERAERPQKREKRDDDMTKDDINRLLSRLFPSK